MTTKNWKAIKEVGGILEQNSLPEGPGMTEARAFLEQVTEIFAESCITYCQITDDLSFAYQEQQLQSVLLPVMAKAAKAVFVEQPVTRRIRHAKSNGRLDYGSIWISRMSLSFIGSE